MLKIINLHACVNGKKILKGINLNIKSGEIHAIMGPNGSGKSTLSYILAGKEGYKITKGDILFEGKSILFSSPEERARLGIFLSFQYPTEIPGLSIINFIKNSINSLREYRGKKNLSSSKILKKINEKCSILGIDKKNIFRSLNEGFSGGEKKKNEIFQMAMLEPKFAILDETDSGLDIDSLMIVAKAINFLKKKIRSFLIITHYQRILKYIIPNWVHVLYNGKIVKSSGKNLASKIELEGYDWIKK
jgi:Fe-S cluster assembly ATP-binding protein